MNRDISLLIARLFFGGLMIYNHGYKYFLEIWPFNDVSFGSSDENIFGLGVIISTILFFLGEFLGPLFVFVGYKTKLFSLLPLITMICAIFLAHSDDPLSGGEEAMLFLAGFSIILLMGPGKYSIDRKFS